MRNQELRDKNFYSDGVLIATKYTRLVNGGRGSYIEFSEECFKEDVFEVQPGQEYRTTPKWTKIVFYLWYRLKNSHKKVYFQLKEVDYADYVPGFYYIFVKDLDFDGELYEE